MKILYLKRYNGLLSQNQQKLTFLVIDKALAKHMKTFLKKH